MLKSKTVKNILTIYGGVTLCGKIVSTCKNAYKDRHEGTKRILALGVWEDDYNNIYNYYGKRVGKVQWNDDVE